MESLATLTLMIDLMEVYKWQLSHVKASSLICIGQHLQHHAVNHLVLERHTCRGVQLQHELSEIQFGIVFRVVPIAKRLECTCLF